MPQKHFSKSKLSMFLRTGCDRELYLSLHTDAVLANEGLPVPLRARPGIGVLKQAGNDFEDAKNAEIVVAFPGLVFGNGNGGIATDDLSQLLAHALHSPTFVLQGRFQPQQFRALALSNLGLNQQAQALVPPLDGMIPDIIVARASIPGEEMVSPDGTRQVVQAGEQRLALVVIDIKHASEPNTSYSAEVALYAYMLANLLQHTGLDQRFFVTATPKLWTRTADGSSRLADVLANNAAATINDKLDALLSDCDDIPFKFYMQTVRRFFGEDLPRVIQLGDANWQSLDWHVGPKCSSCDWLGYGRWLGTADQQRVNARPQHYCAPNAELIDHLSRIVGVTKGARKTFGLHAITTSAAVAQTTGVERPYREHSLLRKERSRIPERASALQTNQVTIDQAALIANLARSPNLQLSIAVNFDAGAGLLTGLALSGRLSFPYRANPVRPLSLGSASYIIDAKLPRQEWVALEAFLLQIEQMIVRAEQEFANNNFWRDVKSDRTEG